MSTPIPERRNYLLLVNISAPQPEHAKLKPALAEIDNSAMFVYFDRHGLSVLLNTTHSAGKIEDLLSGALLNTDRRLIVELGYDWHTFGLDKAAMWFQRHRRT